MYQSQMVAIEALISASAEEMEAIISTSFWLRLTQLGTAYLVFAPASITRPGQVLLYHNGAR